MQMKKEKSPSDQTEHDKSDRSDSSTQKGYLKSGSVQSIYLILTFILCILIFKAVILCCPCFIFITDKALKDAIYVLFREVVVVLSCILILVALHFYDILKLSALDATGTIYCALLAVSIWTALGFVLTLYA